MKFFISYSRKDQAFAQELKTALEAAQYSVWLDLKSIAPGQYYLNEISAGIKDCDVFLLLTSKYSMGNKIEQISGSKEVERELEFAKQRGKTIIPIKLDETWTETAALPGLAMNLVTSQWLDASASDCNFVVKQVQQIIEGGSFNDIQVSVIQEVDKLMAEGHFEKAQQILAANNFDNARIPYIELLSLLISIGHEPVRKLSKNTADAAVRTLEQLPKNEDLMPVILYFLGILSVYYYKQNAMRDATEGFEQLKAQASSLGRLKPKHIKMFNHILPPDNRFSIDWKY